jgi:hypothetical protein
MTTINRLSQASKLSDLDELAIFSRENGSTRKITARQLIEHVFGTVPEISEGTTYSATMGGYNFAVDVEPPLAGVSVWAQITLSSIAVTGTINLPDAAERANGQEVLITCTKDVGTLTVSGSDAIVAGAPVSIVANVPYRMRFDSMSNTWYRVG